MNNQRDVLSRFSHARLSVRLYIRELVTQLLRYISDIQTKVAVWKTFVFDKVPPRNLAQIIVQCNAMIAKHIAQKRPL